MADNDTLVRPKIKPAVKTPKMWAILFLNDDFTPMEFVVYVLVKVLRLDLEEATRLMITIHERGSGKAGLFTRDVAETKAMQINDLARQNEHPLTVTAVEAD